MRARRLAYVCAALTPVWLLALLGIQGRFYCSPWSTPEYGLDVAMDIRAYRDPILASQQAVKGSGPAALTTTEQAADLWLKLEGEGALKPIPPACGDDDGTSGVRQQIDNSKKNLMQSMIRHAMAAERTNDLDTAERLYQKCLRLGQVSKYMSSLTVTNSSSLQLLGLEGLERIALARHSLEESTEEALDAVTSDPGQVSRLLAKHARSTLVSTSDESLRFDPWASPEKILDDLQVQAAVVDSAGDYTSAQRYLVLQSYRVALDLENRVADRKRAVLSLR